VYSKVKLSLCLISKLYAKKTNGGIVPTFLALALDGGEWPFSRPDRFTPGERDPGTRWIGSWVDPTAGLDFVE
jgi:hypothetical protein